MEVTLSLLTRATMESETLLLQSCKGKCAARQCARAATIHHNVPSGVVDGDIGGGNLPPPNLPACLSLIFGAASLNAKPTWSQ